MKKRYSTPTIEISLLRPISIVATSEFDRTATYNTSVGFQVLDEMDKDYRQSSSRGFGSATPWD